MIARHESSVPGPEWVMQLAAPLPPAEISWRQDGRPIQRDGKFFARFVAYVDAQFVRSRLDEIVPGEWDLTLELLPTAGNFADDEGEAQVAFKARLQILGVIREDVGQGRDYKTAASDAFKRAAVRFGIAHELYSYEQNWVQVDGDGKYAKPVEDPGEAYARRQHRSVEQPQVTGSGVGSAPANGVASGASAPAPMVSDEPSCPKCGGKMWDNRISKRNPAAPDFKCRSRSCDGVIWPPRASKSAALPEERGFPPPDDRGAPPLTDADLPF